MQRTLENKTLDIVVPVHNEENSLDCFFRELEPVLKTLKCHTRVIFIDDGSQDATLAKLRLLKSPHFHISVISLTRNFGKEAALTAGIEYSRADICIPIDADLQHPPGVIIELLEKWQQGYDHVIAIRRSRETDSFVRKLAAKAFYRMFNLFSDFNIPNNAGDFRLMTRVVVKRLLTLRERNRFMKGLYVWIGGKTTIVHFDYDYRNHDKSSFNFRRLLRFGLDAITSFSTIPLRLWSAVGFFICLLSGLYGIWLVIKSQVYGVITPGFTTLIVVILFFGGIQLVSLGIIGEYLSRLFIESKQRPIYMIDDVYGEVEAASADTELPSANSAYSASI